METDKRKPKFNPSPTSQLILYVLGLVLLQILVLLSLAAIMRTPTSTATLYVNKCCDVDQILSQDDHYCIQANGTFAEFKVPKYVNESGIQGEYEKNELQFVSYFIKCYNYYIMDPWHNGDQDIFQVSETGLLKNEENNEIVSPEQFCVDRHFNSTYGAVIVCPESFPQNETGIDDNNSDNSDIKNYDHNYKKYLGIGIAISLPFLFCTFSVYALVGKLQNLHGKSLMCHIVTLTMAYISLLIICFKSNIPKTLCKTLGYAAQFSFVACFYWLNIMCFDLWWTFSGHRLRKRDSKAENAKKFKIYSIYTWGCSSLITIITYCIQSLSLSEFLKVPDPNFGTEYCFYDKDKRDSAILYFYGPIGTLIVCNLFMFAHTTIIIALQLRSIDGVVVKSESRKIVKKNKKRFVLYLKLFFIMGVNWLTELLSFGFYESTKNSLIMHFFDFVNVLQGVFIFVIIVCKRDVLILLNEKLYPHKIFIKSLSSSYNTYSSSNNPGSTANNTKSFI